MARNYSPETRKELAAAFKAALKYLARSNSEVRSKSQYWNICSCLDRAWVQQEITSQILNKAKNIIMERLGEGVYYSSWVVEKLGLEVYKTDQQRGGHKTQDGRRRWLKSLIKEFSS